MKNILKFAVILASASLLLIGCATGNKNIQKLAEEPSLEAGYPIIAADVNGAEGYPHFEFQPEIVPDFKHNPSFGIVYGQVLYNNKPVVGYNVYLADLLVDNAGVERIASLKRSSAPQAILDKNGNFVFNEVLPKRYVLMFSDGVGSYLLLLPDSDSEEAIIIEVRQNSETDLGSLNYSDFPLD